MTTSPSPRVRPLSNSAAAVILALAFGAGLAQAQQQAPAPPAPPAQPTAAPVVAPPARVLPPPAPVAVSGRTAATPAVTAAPLVVPRPASVVSPDSIRPAPALLTATPPAGAVARCGDGTFVTTPDAASACATHRGVLVRLPQAPGTPPPPPRSIAPVAASRAAVREAAPPADATMRCKDGTYLFGAPAPSRCEANGGLAVTLPAPRQTPVAPASPRRP